MSVRVIGREGLLRLVEWAERLRTRDLGQASRRRRGGRGNCPQMTVVKIPETALWASFPEVNRNEVLG